MYPSTTIIKVTSLAITTLAELLSSFFKLIPEGLFENPVEVPDSPLGGFQLELTVCKFLALTAESEARVLSSDSGTPPAPKTSKLIIPIPPIKLRQSQLQVVFEESVSQPTGVWIYFSAAFAAKIPV